MAEAVEDADNVKVQVRLYWEAATEWPPVPTQRTLRRQACRLCHVIPRYPYTKPHAQQLVLPEEFNNSWWKLDRAFAALLVFSIHGPRLDPYRGQLFRISHLIVNNGTTVKTERNKETWDMTMKMPDSHPGFCSYVVCASLASEIKPDSVTFTEQWPLWPQVTSMEYG